RRIPEKKESLLAIANADGSGERILATREYPEDFGGDVSAPVWSPDGKIIACGLGENASNDMAVVMLDSNSGKQIHQSSHRWFRVGRLSWAPDGGGIVMMASPGLQFTYQLWYLSVLTDEARRITNDLDNYQSLSVTADGKKLVTVRRATVSNIWVALAANPS